MQLSLNTSDSVSLTCSLVASFHLNSTSTPSYSFADLESIVEYVARDSKIYATAMARRLVDAASSLNVMSARGRIVPEYDDTSIRELIVGSYRLIYRGAASPAS